MIDTIYGISSQLSWRAQDFYYSKTNIITMIVLKNKKVEEILFASLEMILWSGKISFFYFPCRELVNLINGAKLLMYFLVQTGKEGGAILGPK